MQVDFKHFQLEKMPKEEFPIHFVAFETGCMLKQRWNLSNFVAVKCMFKWLKSHKS